MPTPRCLAKVTTYQVFHGFTVYIQIAWYGDVYSFWVPAICRYLAFNTSMCLCRCSSGWTFLKSSP